jgi:isoaspartyl peptidase/L-asparaginase-like protein (Ntn-hydrolase superfamily)
MAGCEAAESSFAWGDHTVGPDGSPDFTGETTLDALLCDGATGDVGAVAYLRRIPSAIRAARAVMHYSRHSLLAGEGATALASYFGGQAQSNLTYNNSQNAQDILAWRAGGCQPIYYDPAWALGANVTCGPYGVAPQPSPTPLPPAQHGSSGWRSVARARNAAAPHRRRGWATPSDHDTLGLCALDVSGSLAAGVTSNGARHKVAGRVGDAPLIGAGAYASNDAGGCAAVTGDGDITQRFLPSFLATESMRAGVAPLQACEGAVRRIMASVSDFAIGIVCLNAAGEYAAASHGWSFTYCAQGGGAGAQPNCTKVVPLG